MEYLVFYSFKKMSGKVYLESETFVTFTELTTGNKLFYIKHIHRLMKKITLAIALFAFVGTASVNAAVIKHEGEKTEKAEKKEAKA